MPAARMRMRQWLQMMIESGSVPGLVWVDKEKHMFSIPWKHAARHGWQLEKDASLFKLWAVHTGKHVEGQTCDPKTWKANFRCALNSLPDIEEVKDRSINKGHQAMRVFRMLPAIPRVKVKRSKTRELAKRKVRTEDDTDDSDSQSPAGSPELRDDVAFSTQENLVDSTVHVELQGDVEVCSVPDTLTWPLLDELRPSSFSNGVSRGFEISPDCSPLSSPHHFPDYSYDIIEICQQMEKDPAYSSELQSSELQSSQPCTSPGSLWSESSGDDLDDLPQYTTLGSDIIASSVSDLWNNLNFSMT